MFFLFWSWYIFKGHGKNRSFNRFLDAQCKSKIFFYLEFQALIYSRQYISDSFKQVCATAAPGFVGGKIISFTQAYANDLFFFCSHFEWCHCIFCEV